MFLLILFLLLTRNTSKVTWPHQVREVVVLGDAFGGNQAREFCVRRKSQLKPVGCLELLLLISQMTTGLTPGVLGIRATKVLPTCLE